MTENSLTTERLQLQLPTPTDALAIWAIAGDPTTTLHNPSDLLERPDQADELVQRWIAHWAAHGFGYWCIREHGDPTIIGYCGLKTSSVQQHQVLNLICRLTPNKWGNGYATEAGSAAIAWTTDQNPLIPVLGRIRPDNLASQNVARKLGLHRDPDLDSNGEDGLDLAFTNRT